MDGDPTLVAEEHVDGAPRRRRRSPAARSTAGRCRRRRVRSIRAPSRRRAPRTPAERCRRFAPLRAQGDDTAMDRATVEVYEEGAERLARHAPGAVHRAGGGDRTAGRGRNPARSTSGAGPGCTCRRSASRSSRSTRHTRWSPRREIAPDSWPIQGDLEHLPFRRGAIGGSWARASYLHVPRTRLPWSLMELHVSLAVGAPAAFVYRHGEIEGKRRGRR